jgi:hypothetical protein
MLRVGQTTRQRIQRIQRKVRTHRVKG